MGVLANMTSYEVGVHVRARAGVYVCGFVDMWICGWVGSYTHTHTHTHTLMHPHTSFPSLRSSLTQLCSWPPPHSLHTLRTSPKYIYQVCGWVCGWVCGSPKYIYQVCGCVCVCVCGYGDKRERQIERKGVVKQETGLHIDRLTHTHHRLPHQTRHPVSLDAKRQAAYVHHLAHHRPCHRLHRQTGYAVGFDSDRQPAYVHRHCLAHDRLHRQTGHIYPAATRREMQLNRLALDIARAREHIILC